MEADLCAIHFRIRASNRLDVKVHVYRPLEGEFRQDLPTNFLVTSTFSCLGKRVGVRKQAAAPYGVNEDNCIEPIRDLG